MYQKKAILLSVMLALALTGCGSTAVQPQKNKEGVTGVQTQTGQVPEKAKTADPELKIFPVSSLRDSSVAEYFSRKEKIINTHSKICKAKAKGNKLILSIYDQNNRKTKTIQKNLNAYISEYKKLKIMKLQKINNQKIRIIYGEADTNGTGTSGGSVVVNINNSKIQSRVKYNFWPCSTDDRSAYVSAWNKITVIDLKTGEKKKVYQISDVSGTYLNQIYAYKNGKFIYVDQSGIYMSKQGTDQVEKICDWRKYAGRDLHIRDIYMRNETMFYIGFAESEDLPLETVMRVKLRQGM